MYKNRYEDRPSKVLKVLVVEDNPDTAEVIGELIECLGYAVTVATHPAEAVSKVREQQFDFFLLDIGLPEMNGYQLVGALRNMLHGKHVTFAAHTAYGSPIDKALAAHAGFDYHFVKPADISALTSALSQAQRHVNLA